MKTSSAVLGFLCVILACDEEDLMPASPINLNVVVVTNTSIGLAWTDNSTNESGFIIERRTLGGTFAEVARTYADVCEFADNQLIPNAQYSYRVLAFNAVGLSAAYTNEVTAITLKEATSPAPASPIDLKILSVTKSTIEIKWTDNSTNEDGFIVERKVFGGAFTEIAQTEAEVSEFKDTQLTPSTEYSYRVLAFNSGGESPSYTNVVTIFTLKESEAIGLKTADVTWVGSKSAFSGGSFASNAFPPVTVQGVVWSTSPSPTIALTTKTTDNAIPANGKFEYESVITGLAEVTKYYVRAYATNAEETVYGSEFEFITSAAFFAPGAGVTDIDGNAYKTVIVREQEWMAENLRTTKYANGDLVNDVADPLTNWATDLDGAWLYPGNLEENDVVFGKFYDWYAVSNSKLVCPTDWHVPTLVEWNELLNNLGGPDIAGMRLKDDKNQWDPSPGTDEGGFEALPAGNLWMYPTPFKTTIWWTSTSEAVNANITVMYLSENQNLAQEQMSGPRSGLSVRCLKD